MDELEMADVNVHVCAYNAFVNCDVPRGRRKMADLGRAINRNERVRGREKLRALVAQGVIDSFKPCPPECAVRPGGLFHAEGCENEMNHPAYRERQRRAREMLPGGPGGHGGWHAASVALVGEGAPE